MAPSGELPRPEPATISAQLAASLTQWLSTGNRDELRRSLVRVLRLLDPPGSAPEGHTWGS